jgi:glycosyltransferase involved in cell wall biosynthesis
MIALVQAAPAYGAIERYLARIAAGLGEEAVLVFPDVPELVPFRELPVRLQPLPRTTLESAPRALTALARLFRELRPRLVHVNDPFPPAVLAARLARVPRVLLTHHTPELPRRDNTIGRAWLRLMWSLRPEVIYTSESDRAADGRTGLTTHVVYYGIDLERFRAAGPALPRDGRVVGTVGRLVPQKGLHDLIAAAPMVTERHPDVRFVVAGDGPQRAELEAAAEGRVLFTGWREDVPELLASFDVYALPSHFEGLCYAVIEAQAAGVPVVATPVGGVRENVVEGETGLLARPGDPASLAAGINRLLDDPELARRLSGEARRRVFERYDVRRMVEETIALYARPAAVRPAR